MIVGIGTPYKGVFHVSAVSDLTGEAHVLTYWQGHYDKLNTWLHTAPEERKLLQQEFPDMTTDEREFILTGITKAEWDQIFGSEED